jgi:pSer/pThr/pTyr-binding forkhead associated (FHA) protein
MRSAAQSLDDCGFALTGPAVDSRELPAWSVSQADSDRALGDRFRLACGQLSCLRIDIRSADSGTEHPAVLWDRPSLIVGSGEDCDLRLPDAEVSSAHAYFQFLGGRLYCADLDSRTGTHWSNGASQAGWVEPHEPVIIGPYSLTFTFDSRPRSTDAGGQDSAEPHSFAQPHDVPGSVGCDTMPLAAETYLDFVNVGPNVRRYRVSREVTLIGSGAGVKIHLTHPSVSTAHCSVVRTSTGLWIVDLLSAEGTIVNGQVEPLAALQPGDEFQVGRFLMAVHYGRVDEAGAPAQARSNNGLTVNAATAATTTPAAPHWIPADAHPAGRSCTGDSAAPPNTPPDAVQDASHARHTHSMPMDGLSEQLMLNVVQQLGEMQQQFLRQVQDSLKETLAQFSSAYEQRLDALERAHAALRSQLVDRQAGTPATATVDQRAGDETPKGDDSAALLASGSQTARVNPIGKATQNASGTETAKPTRNGAPVSGQFGQETRDRVGRPPANHHVPPSAEQAPRSTGDLNAPLDSDNRARWMREQIKSIELELEATGRGWEKKLVELLGQ